MKYQLKNIWFLCSILSACRDYITIAQTHADASLRCTYMYDHECTLHMDAQYMNNLIWMKDSFVIRDTYQLRVIFYVFYWYFICILAFLQAYSGAYVVYA